MTCSVSVVLPEDPAVDFDHAAARQSANASAMSSPSEPVETAWMSRDTSCRPGASPSLCRTVFDLAQRGGECLDLSSANAGDAMVLSPIDRFAWKGRRYSGCMGAM